MSEDQRRVEELLSGLLDDELSDEERREALSLTRRDPAARALFERMRATAEAIRAEEPPAPPPDLAAKIGARVRESGGDLIESSRRRWVGPATLAAAASVAAALLIGALLHDHWEVFAPRLAYEEQKVEEAREPSAPAPEMPAKEQKALPAEEPRRDETEVFAPGADSLERAAPVPAAPAASAERDQLRQERSSAAGEPAVADQGVSATLDQLVDREEGRIAEEKSRRTDYETRSALPSRPKAEGKTEPLACASPWTSSTRVGPAEDAPKDAAERLRALVAGLGGRVENAPEASLVIPAAGVDRFLEGLPGTGHDFVGPSPVLPADRDCLRLRLTQPLP